MPPRASKKRGGAAAAKKTPAAPRATRASARNSKKSVEEVRIEEEQEEEIMNQIVAVQEENESPPAVVQIDDDEEEANTESIVSSLINYEVVQKEEVFMNLENVEETKDVEEVIVEEKNVEVVMEETVTTVVEETTVVVVEEAKVVQEEVVEEKGSEMVVIEKKKVVDENVEGKNMEIMDADVDKKVVEKEEEPEEDPEEIVEKNLVKLVEENPEEIVEKDPEEIEEGPEEVIEDGNKNRSGDGDDMVDDQQVAEQDINEESTKAEAEDIVEGNDGSDAYDSGDMEGEDESGSDGEGFEGDEDPSAYMHAPLTDRKKQKEFEIFVGGLDKGAIEEDLTEVFAKFGEIKSMRIVKHPTSQKSKGFAFIRYATVEQAKKVLDELKDGAEVKGKRVGISPSQDSDTIYMGNICKTWKKDQVLEALKSLGIEQIEEIYLPDDPKNEEKTRGFTLLEFSTHSDAMAAFQRLRKPDAVFGCDRSAKVAFAQSSIHPSEEALLQVKTVFVEGLTDLWNEERLREFGKQYGEIEKVQLSRDLGTTKRKDFGFISFTSRESAVACVEGFENVQVAEGDAKIKANLAKPQYKGRLGKQSARGGYKVKMDGTVEAGSSKMKGPAKCSSEGKGKFHQNSKGAMPSKPQPRVGEHQGPGAPSRSDHHRREQPGRGGRRGGRNMEGSFHGQTSMKPRGNMHGRPGRDFPRSNSQFGHTSRKNYGYGPYADPYTQRLPPSAPGYRGHASYGAYSGTKHHYSDMEPHARYIEASPLKQSRYQYNYEPKRGAGGYGGQGGGPTAYTGPQPSYAPSNSVYPGYETGSRGHAYRGGPTSYAQPHPRPLPQPQPYARQPPHPHPHQMQPHPHQQPYPHPQQNPYPYPHTHPHPPPPPPGYY